MLKRFKSTLGYLVLITTIIVFVVYGETHKQLWHTLAHISILEVILLLFLYLVILGVIILLLELTAEICGKKMDFKENSRISAYSLLVNFFGPLQSGPGFRAFYLKKKYSISFRSFFGATIIYYLFYAAISGIIAIAPSAYWRWLLLIVPGGLVLLFVCYKLYMARQRKIKAESFLKSFHKKLLVKLAVATLIQVIMLAIVYFVELRIVSNSITLRQAFIYTGVANLSLFVSLTPGGIGIREAFLLFTNKLHHIPSKTVIAASVIDRSVYIVFLAIVFIVSASLHINSRLGLNRAKSETSTDKQNKSTRIPAR